MLTPTVYSQDDLNSYEYIKVDIELDIEFGVELNPNSIINNFEVSSYFFPQTIENSQYLNSFETNTDYSYRNSTGFGHIEYYLTNSTIEENNKISSTYTVQSTIFRPEITKKYLYPINSIEEEYEKYLEFGELIDIDDNIRNQASSLAQGEDDVFIIASKIAKWIREDINYDLSTIAENPDQSSAEVFQSKAGVCKEITNLYISMLRSLGIPARVISGYAYTTSPDVVDFVGSNWGGHAWAEVLIGDTWVPFDLTYNQYGFVDSTHIVLDKSPFLRTQSVSINASGFDFSLKKNTLNVKTEFEILEKEKRIFDHGFEVELSGPENLGFGSYGYIKAEVTNTKDFYQIFFSNVAKTKDIINLDPLRRMLILEPGETKEVYFRYQVPQDLESGFIYTLPFRFYNEYIDEEFELKSRADYEILEESDLPEEQEDEMSFSNNDIFSSCSFKFGLPLNTLNCTIKNVNNYEISDLEVCLDLDCRNLNLKLNEEEQLIFNTDKLSGFLDYSFGNKKGNIRFAGSSPSFSADMSLNEQLLTLSYDIKHYNENLRVILYDNEDEFKIYSNRSAKDSIALESGQHNLTLALEFGENQLEAIEQTFIVESKFKISLDKFIQTIADFFSSLF